MSAGSIAAGGSGRLEISSEPVKGDNYLRHLRVTIGGLNGLSLGATFEVDQAPDIVAQLRRTADTIEAWNGGRATFASDAICVAMVRRNSVDGGLYACGLQSADAVHGSTEECAGLIGRPCDRPGQHHPFEAVAGADVVAVPA